MDTANSTVSSQTNLHVFYWEQVLTAILILIIATSGIIGNSLLLLAVAFCQKLHTSTNSFVTSLSVADLLTAAHLIWYAIGVLGQNEWPIQNATWLCTQAGFTIYACRGTSLYTLAAIAVNRYMFITKPSCMYNQVFSSWKLVILIAIPWIIPRISLIILLLCDVGEFGYDAGDYSCSAIGSDPPDFMAISIAIMGFPIPLVLVVFSYTKIYLYLRKHFHAKKISLAMISSQAEIDATSNAQGLMPVSSRIDDRALDLNMKERQLYQSTSDLSAYHIGNVNHAKQHRQISQEHIKITKNLFLIVCSVYICFLPYFILLFLKNSHVHFYARIITFSNSAINFAIHASKHQDFNLVIRHILRGSFSKIPQPSKLLRFLLSRWK